MNLKARIQNHLRDGAVRSSDGKAVAVLAGCIQERESTVRQVLGQLLHEGQLDLDGTLKHATQIALRSNERFRPVTAEGRRQSRYATDAEGRRYSGTIRPGHPNYRPAQTRLMTHEEWHKSFPDTPYPIVTPASTNQEQPMSTTSFESTPEGGVSPTTQAVTRKATALKGRTRKQTKAKKSPAVPKLTPARQDRIDQLKQLIADEAGKCSEGLVPTELFVQLTSEELGVSLAAIRDDLTILRKIGFLDTVKLEFRGISYIKLVPQPVIPESYRGKLDAVLELFREMQANNQGGLTAAAAKRIGYTNKSIQTVLRLLRAIEAYRTDRSGRTSRLIFVQAEPLTNEQFKRICQLRTEWSNKQPETITAVSEVKSTVAVAPQPSAAPVDTDLDALLRSLVERRRTDKDLIASQEAEIARLREAMQRQDVQHASHLERLELLTLQNEHFIVMLEVERGRPVQTGVDSSLLEEARALLDS